MSHHPSLSPKPGQVQQNMYHLCLVDDDQVVRTSLARRLRREGFEIQEFESGESILAYLARAIELPDAIILDYTMPGLNGIETTKRIRQQCVSVPIILLTAYTGAFDLDQARREGVCQVFTKSIELEKLLSTIYQALQPHGNNKD